MSRQLLALLLGLGACAASPTDSLGPATVDGKCPPGSHVENGLCYIGAATRCTRPVGPVNAAGSCAPGAYRNGDTCCAVPNCCRNYLGKPVNGLCPNGYYKYNSCCCYE